MVWLLLPAVVALLALLVDVQVFRRVSCTDVPAIAVILLDVSLSDIVHTHILAYLPSCSPSSLRKGKKKNPILLRRQNAEGTQKGKQLKFIHNLAPPPSYPFPNCIPSALCLSGT
jgi:hypothetical protein